LGWLEEHEINVVVRNLGLQSRPQGKKNPIWGLLSATMSSLYTLELENIRERTATGRQVYVMNGGRLGRPNGSTESEKRFMENPKTQQIIKLLEKGRTVREIAAITECSSKTVQKVKQIAVR
jgi:DNA invertase Pin-like site-specific DNA recombinase